MGESTLFTCGGDGGGFVVPLSVGACTGLAGGGGDRKIGTGTVLGGGDEGGGGEITAGAVLFWISRASS